jgi:hypothetical protein
VDDGVTNAELARRLDDMSGNLREDMGEFRAALATLMPREVYEARHTALIHRVDVIDQRESKDVADIKADLAREQERRQTLMRWVVGAVVLPVVLFIGQVVINAVGVGA